MSLRLCFVRPNSSVDDLEPRARDCCSILPAEVLLSLQLSELLLAERFRFLLTSDLLRNFLTLPTLRWLRLRFRLARLRLRLRRTRIRLRCLLLALRLRFRFRLARLRLALRLRFRLLLDDSTAAGMVLEVPARCGIIKGGAIRGTCTGMLDSGM